MNTQRLHNVMRLLVLFLILAGFCACRPISDPADEEFDLPDLLPPGSHVLMATPEPGDKILIIPISDAQNSSQEQGFVRGFASNSLAINSGSWTAKLISQSGETIDFAIQEPGVVHGYDPNSSLTIHSIVDDMPVYVGDQLMQGSLVIPYSEEYRDLQINQIDILDENKNLIQSTYIDFEKETYRLGDTWQFENFVATEAQRLVLEGSKSEIAVNPSEGDQAIDVILGQSGESDIQIGTGEVEFVPETTWQYFGFTVMGEWTKEPLIELTVNGETQWYIIDELRNGQELAFGDEGIRVVIDATESAEKTYRFAAIDDSLIEGVAISGENLELNNVTSLESH